MCAMCLPQITFSDVPRATPRALHATQLFPRGRELSKAHLYLFDPLLQPGTNNGEKSSKRTSVRRLSVRNIGDRGYICIRLGKKPSLVPRSGSFVNIS